MPDMSIVATATQVTTDALTSLRNGRHVIIRAHAGAGKTGGQDSGTVRIAHELAADGLRVALLVPQNDQVVESLTRLSTIWPDTPVSFVPATASWPDMPGWIRNPSQRPANLRVARSGTAADKATKAQFETKPGLYVMTASKFTYLAPTGYDIGNARLTVVEPFDVVIVDEAWMAPASLWEVNLQYLTRLVALVGDPGQILPWLPDSVFYPGMLGSPIEPLPSLMAARLSGRVDTHDLPVTRRNPSHTTAITGLLPAYCATPTRPMYDASEVGLTLGARPLHPDDTDLALHAMSNRGVALQTLPGGVAPQNDRLVAQACAQAAIRLFSLGAQLHHPTGNRPLSPSDVGILVAHHDQRVAVLAELTAIGLIGSAAPKVATFNTIQGATLAVSIVWHPLSGRTDVSTFHADTGRLTVGLTRHTHACLLVGRDDIGDRLFGSAVSQDLEGDARDGRFVGLSAHRTIWDRLTA
jgi:hypothetical protein